MDTANPVDAKPVLKTDTNSIFNRLERQRDRIFLLLQDAMLSQNIKGELTKSTPFAFQTFVLLRAWLPIEGNNTFRTQVKIVLQADTTRIHPIWFEIGTECGGFSRIKRRIIDFEQEHAVYIIEHLIKASQSHRIAAKGLNNYRFNRFGIFFNRNRTKKYRHDWRFLPEIFHPKLQLTHSSGKPEKNPRELVRMDTWQTLVINLGGYSEQTMQEIEQELVDGKHAEAFINQEEISYFSSNGKVQRNQIVVNFRRAIAFIEIHAYGDDLYVDWEAYLNLGIWKEFKVTAGSNFDLRASVQFHEIRRGLEILNEYDISDANFLIEWVHACITKILKRLQKEQKIDQEIDFKIQRTSRKDVLQEGSSDSVKKKSRQRLS